MNKRIGRKPIQPEERRKRFQAVVAPCTLSWLESHNEAPGRVLDRLVAKEKLREDFNNE